MMRLFVIVIRSALWLAAIAGLPARCAQAHPFHTTTAEMEWNAQTGRYEVSLKILLTDLEEALTRHAYQGRPAGARISCEQTPDIDARIVAYLKERFQLIPAAEAGSEIEDKPVESRTPARAAQAHSVQTAGHRLRWIGKEVDKAWAWLYFELESPANGQPLALHNSVLFELNAGQINICTVRRDSRKVALRTDVKRSFVALPP